MLLDLPEIPLPDWVLGLHLLGPVTRESVLAGLYDGLRLGTIVICVGAANALANPKRLLRSVPAALHEIGTALVVAVTVLPQLATAPAGCGPPRPCARGTPRRTGRLRRYLVPVLEDALERSLRLAAGMDTRGYGRSGGRAAGRAPADRRADAARACAVSRRGLRRPRPHRAAARWPPRCWSSASLPRWRGWSWPGAGSAGPATAPTRGAGRSWR